MENWREVLEKFISEFRDRDYVIGAILCGSYATGNYTKRSDIDVHIITKDISYKERGNVIIDGIMIEYFINPLSEAYKYLENDFKNKRRLADANMYVNGVVLFDKTGEIEKLREDSKKYYDLEFDEPDKVTVMKNNYTCWDLMDEMNDRIDNNEDYVRLYWKLLEELISNYYYKNKISTVPFTKIEKIYRNKEYRENYHLKNMPPQEFLDLVLNAIDNITYDSLKSLYDYVIGDFKITDFVLRTELDNSSSLDQLSNKISK